MRKPVRVLALSVSDNVGGAARAAYRLHQGLTQIDVGSTMLVRHKQHGDPKILTVEEVGGKIGQTQSKLAYLLDRRPLLLYPHL